MLYDVVEINVLEIYRHGQVVDLQLSGCVNVRQIVVVVNARHRQDACRQNCYSGDSLKVGAVHKGKKVMGFELWKLKIWFLRLVISGIAFLGVGKSRFLQNYYIFFKQKQKAYSFLQKIRTFVR